MKPFVVAAAVISMTMPATVSLQVGQRQQLKVTETLSDKNTKAGGSEVNWVSSDTRVVGVINSASPVLNGTVIARRPGTAKVSATTAGAITNSTTVTVTEVKK